jgi:hypothetical protein
MANANKPMGLAPVKYLSGANWDGRGNMYYIDSTDTNQYNIGDPVMLKAGLDQKYGIQTVARATVGSNPILGAVLAIGTNPQGGPFIDPTNLTLVSAPGTKTKGYYVLVADDPMIVYEIQEGGSGYTSSSTALTYTAANKNGQFYYSTPATGAAFSAVTLDAVTGVGTTATLQLKILGAVQRNDNTPFSVYQKWLVKINNHPYAGGTGTVGY